MHIVISGASAAGQFAALLLARAGHDIVLVDRDDVAAPADVAAAASSAFRPTAPHLVQPHALLPRCRLLLREHLPDVYGALLSAGAVEAPLSIAAPPGVAIDAQPDDDDFVAIATRRSTLDFVLRRAVAAEKGITCRFGVKVNRLLSCGGNPPHVRGVRTDAGDIDADLVIDATGRRTSLDSWLVDIGAAPTDLDEAECGLCYRSRHYRLRPHAKLPGHPATRVLLALEQFTTGLWNGDNGSALIAISPLAADHRFRSVNDPDVFDAVAATVPAYRPWLDVFEPVSEVFVMAGLHNTYRRLVVDGKPVVTGLALVGDSRCTTNPTFGRGLALALIEAADLRDALTDLAGDPIGLAHRLDDQAAEHVEPFYVDQAHNDSERLADLRHAVFGTTRPAPPPRTDAVTFAELRQALPAGATALRTFWRVMGMLDVPESVYTDPGVVQSTREALRDVAQRPPMPQPTAEDLDAALATAAHSGRG